MITVIDSWAWIEYFKGSLAGEKVKKTIEVGGEFIISSINAAEVYRHFLSNYNEEDAKSAISFMLTVAFVTPVSLPIAINSAKIKHEKKIGLGDSIIMATAAEHKAHVLTGDPDFKKEKNVIYIGK